MTHPPGDSLEVQQRGHLAGDLSELLARIREELAYSDAKGAAPYRLGMHDGLRFAEDAVVELLRRVGRPAETIERPADA
ncbi:hypothetical protein BH23ACT7_BH23ACT7_27630 [soil metagenome]